MNSTIRRKKSGKPELLEEEWFVRCLDDWEKWYGRYAIPHERKQLNHIRRTIENPKTPNEKIIDLYWDGIEILHHLLLCRIEKEYNAKIIQEKLNLFTEDDLLGRSTIKFRIKNSDS